MFYNVLSLAVGSIVTCVMVFTYLYKLNNGIIINETAKHTLNERGAVIKKNRKCKA